MSANEVRADAPTGAVPAGAVPTAWRSRAAALAPYVALYAGFAMFAAAANFADPGADFWVRLAAGRLVVEERIIPRNDPFSFTALGDPWIDHEWILEATMYTLNQVSFALLAVVAAIAAVAPFAIMHRWAARRRGADAALLLLVALCMLVAWRTYTIRPQLVNPILFATLLVLIDAQRRDGGRRIWLSVPLMLVWANLQAGFMAGLGLLGAYCLAEVLEGRRPLLPGAVLLASAAVCLLNAYGIELYVYTLGASLTGNPDRTYVEEWQSPDFHDVLNLPTLAGMAVLAYFGMRSGDRFAQVVALSMLVATLISARFVPFLALAMIFVIAPQLGAVAIPRRVQGALVALAVPLLTIVTAAFVLTARHEPSTDGVAVDGLAYIVERDPDPRIYAEQGWASYMALEGIPTFMDTRTHQVFSDELIESYWQVSRTTGDWEAVLDEWDIDYVLIFRTSDDLGLALEARGWEAVFEGDIETVWTRP